MENKEMRCRDVAYTINRSVLYEQELGGPAPNPPSTVRSFVGAAKRKFRCSASAAKQTLFQFIPILHWLPRYPVKEWLLGDIVSGVSVGILQLPQGLAYALLAGVPPVFGLYSSFFPVMVYSIFGTSRHVSIGSFAVVSIMIGSVTESLVPNDNFILPGNDSLLVDTVARDKARVEVVAAMTLLVGLFQIILGLVQFGFVVTYLSKPLVRGYTTAATIHVTVSQLKHIFGLPLSEKSQPLSLIYSLVSLFRRIQRTNIGTLVIGLVCLTCLFAVKEVNQRLRGKLPMPIPIELIVLVISTGISYGINLHEKYGVDIVGDIPTGVLSTTRLVTPIVPKAELFVEVVGNAFAIAVVGYTITISLAKMFAMKHGYKVDSNQELIALGFSNLVGSFFHCFAVTASMSRTLVQESTGGNTQVASTVSALIILVIILKAGELFTCLPRAILSGIVIANLKGMYKQFMDIPILWQTNKFDLLIWLVTFLSTICLNMDIGLAVSVVFGLFTVTFRSQLPHYSILGQVYETDLYRDAEENSMAKEISGIKIFHWNAAIYFANAELYSKALKAKMGVNVDRLIEKKKKAAMKRKKGLQKVIRLAKNILAKTQMIFEEVREIEVDVYLASCPTSVLRQLEYSHFFKGSVSQASVFASVHDAVSYLSYGISESSSVQEITEI
ncbi:hypothetical protein XELAEV_18025916mg [Xenopus laevis]|uniref:STAS domain-containing protein n=1 Tax=Xenopus laevis TaxID=8355 RepID=A0A974HMI7_XENLA|nr:hypothetical protein XELAEV_18025916mg [Xenopus laevis]